MIELIFIEMAIMTKIVASKIVKIHIFSTKNHCISKNAWFDAPMGWKNHWSRICVERNKKRCNYQWFTLSGNSKWLIFQLNQHFKLNWHRVSTGWSQKQSHFFKPNFLVALSLRRVTTEVLYQPNFFPGDIWRTGFNKLATIWDLKKTLYVKLLKQSRIYAKLLGKMSVKE